jgi:inosine-uridine nucleoside N-ribohydrolase
LVLDCDPGHDDVFAILVALERADLVAVTAVSGNAPLAASVRNALITLQLAGADVPVHVGAERPLVREARHASYIHGESGLDGPVLPALTREASDVPAVEAILAAAAARDDLWLVATGPLTNVALALRQDPSLAKRLAGISVMGGTYGAGNVTAAAEFNIWADPEAAAEVFSSGARLVMSGLDLTHQFMITRQRIAEVRALANPLAAFGADLLTYFAEAYARSFGGEPEGPLHDPCAVLAVTDPHLFTTADYHVAVETHGEVTRGATVVDRRTGRRSGTPNTTVLETIDDGAAFAVLLEALGSPGPAATEGAER